MLGPSQFCATIGKERIDWVGQCCVLLMSKRKHIETSTGGTAQSSASRDRDLTRLEQRLHELQNYCQTYLVKNSLIDGTPSTRVFFDPLLNLEMKLMKERELEL